MTSSKTLVVFHRCGGKALGYPPNALVTAKWARDFGAKAIEYDIVFCSFDDGGKVVVIEPKLLKQAGLDIDNLDWKDVEKINTGNDKFGTSSPATLEAMLQKIDTNTVAHQIHIKGKNPKTLGVLLPALRNVKNYVLTTFDISVIRDIKRRDKNVPVGWIVKPKQEKGSEGSEDLTAAVTSARCLSPYLAEELDEITKEARKHDVQIIILCGPQVQEKRIVEEVSSAGFEVGAWGVGTNLDLARKLIEFQIDRFTLDNPEQL